MLTEILSYHVLCFIDIYLPREKELNLDFNIFSFIVLYMISLFFLLQFNFPVLTEILSYHVLCFIDIYLPREKELNLDFNIFSFIVLYMISLFFYFSLISLC